MHVQLVWRPAGALTGLVAPQLTQVCMRHDVFSLRCCACFAAPLQVPNGAWFSLALSFALCGVCSCWHWGQALKIRHIGRQAVPFASLLQKADSGGAPASGQAPPLRVGGGGPLLARVPGVGIFYSEILGGSGVGGEQYGLALSGCLWAGGHSMQVAWHSRRPPCMHAPCTHRRALLSS